jgi:hypothetical protein
MEVGLKNNYWGGAALRLSVLPMPKTAPIYIDDQARRLLQLHPGAKLLRARLVPQYESVLTLAVDESKVSLPTLSDRMRSALPEERSDSRWALVR